MADFLLRSTSSTERANSTAYALGDRVVIARADAQTNFALMRKYVYQCTTAGTSAGAVPVYPTTPGGTVTDGSVVWTCREAQTWLNAARYADYIVARMGAGDRLLASQGHAESSASNLTITFPGTITAPCYFICVDDSIGGDSPTTESTGASVANTGSVTMTINGSVIARNVIFSCGGGNLSINQSASIQDYETCDFILAASASQQLVVSSSGSGSVSTKTLLNNCRYQFGNTASRIKPSNIVELNGGSIISGTTPVSLFTRPTSNTPAYVTVRNFDYTNLGSGFNLAEGGSYGASLGSIEFHNCIMPSGWNGLLVATAITTIGFTISAYNIDYADTNFVLWEENYSGSIKHDTVLYLAGTDGQKLNGSSVPLSYKMASGSNSVPLEGNWRIYANEVNTSQTAKIQIIHNESALLKNNEIWIELDYPQTAGSSKFTRATIERSNILATPSAQATSTADWDDGLTERVNSFTYAAGNIIKSAGSPGSAFICTAGGTSASSVPGGYTSAADGASITDGTATFKAMKRQELGITFTAAEQGIIRARVMLILSGAIVWAAAKISVA